MAINVSQSFHRTSANAVDDTLTLTKAQMLAVNDNLMPSKYLTICQDDGKLYVYDKSATPSVETGKFKRYGGHDIEDDQGTAVTPRDVLQFGDGFDVSDDSTNAKTVVEPSLMDSTDMDDVVTPLPSVYARYHEYSTSEQVVGKWIDGKTVYERVFTGTLPTCVTDGTGVSDSVDMGASVDSFINCFLKLANPSTNNEMCLEVFNLSTIATSGGSYVGVRSYACPNNSTQTANRNKVFLVNSALNLNNYTYVLVVRYTKAT